MNRDVNAIGALGNKGEGVLWFHIPTQTLELKLSIEVKVTCVMDFNLYPFDSHHCELSFGDDENEVETQVIDNLLISVENHTTQFGQPGVKLDNSHDDFVIFIEGK